MFDAALSEYNDMDVTVSVSLIEGEGMFPIDAPAIAYLLAHAPIYISHLLDYIAEREL